MSQLARSGNGYTIGQRTGMIDGSGRTMWTYDARGRQTREEKLVNTNNYFITSWDYNSADLLKTMTYPGGNSRQAGETVTYAYHSQMAFHSVTGNGSPAYTYVQSSSYEAAGRVKQRTLGTGTTAVQTQYNYYEWDVDYHGGRLQWLKSGTPNTTPANPTAFQHFEYSYSAVGNVMSISDFKMGSPQTQTYTYDNLDRLITAAASGGSQGNYSENYTYNDAGNLASKAGVTYNYGDANHDHAVTGLSNGNTYQYDANGNMTQRHVYEGGAWKDYTLVYDAENRLVSVSGATTAAFVYDGDGKRVKATFGGVTTTYVNNYYEWTGSTGTMVKYYYAGATRVAMRTVAGDLKWLLGEVAS